MRTSGVDGRPTPDRPLVVCRCGAIAAGKDGQHWQCTDSADGKRATLAPSFNWPGHFHVFAVDVPYITYRELYPELFVA